VRRRIIANPKIPCFGLLLLPFINRLKMTEPKRSGSVHA
jgi:hypothetical protein